MSDTISEPRQLVRPEDVRAKIRDDLIRRLFAVAISVGAAATIAQMGWVQSGRWPCMAEWQQLLILIAAMTATVLSWDGYLFSIAERPLRNFWRFAIDILLVFIYMFLLMTSKLLVWWVFIHALIYTLYAIWDLLTVYDWKSKYYYGPATGPHETIREVYVGGLLDRPNVSRGPIITIVWGAYFWALYLLNDRVLHWLNLPGLEHRIIGTTLFVTRDEILKRSRWGAFDAHAGGAQILEQGGARSWIAGLSPLIPANAGIQSHLLMCSRPLGPRLRGDERR